MTRRLFIKRLRFALRGGFSKNESRDVISDYEGFFDQGYSNGAGEDTVSAELGDPVSIALSIAREAGKAPPIGALLLKYQHVTSLLIGAALFGFALLLFYAGFWLTFWIDGLTLNIICLLMADAGLLIALRPRLTAPDAKRDTRGLIASNAVLLALSVFCCVFFSNKASIDLAVWFVDRYPDPFFLGIFINGVSQIRLLCVLTAAGIGLHAVIAAWRGKAERILTALHALGFCAYLEVVANMWRTLDIPENYYRFLALNTVVYVVGAALAALVLIRLVYKKEARANDNAR
ncbi:MAG: DUF1700 domain-containing protein [Clostridiales bacterium]|jgi:uncharacterized membrane protein|nr:DUF1700 domain-containing protein [Clostridiales bacterium]